MEFRNRVPPAGFADDSTRLWQRAVLAEFFVLGLPDGLIGAAWPAMAADFGTAVSALSVLLIVGTCGFVTSSVGCGHLLGRVRPRRLILVASGAAVVGSLVVCSARSLTEAAAGVLVLGVTGGALDSVLSTLVSLGSGHRVMGLMHGTFGVGAAIGPLIVAGWVLASSWRGAYMTLCLAQVAVVAMWLHRRQIGPLNASPEKSHHQPAEVQTRLPWVAAASGVALFFVSSGLEVSAGAWGTSYLVGRYGVSTAAAATGVFGYWIAVSASRFAVGLRPRLGNPVVWLVGGAFASLAGAAVLWWAPSPLVVVVGLVGVGLGCGPMFPVLTTLTPARVGVHAAADVIGWQLGAAALGGALIAASIGPSVHHFGFWSIGAAITFVAACLCLLVVPVAIGLPRALLPR